MTRLIRPVNRWPAVKVVLLVDASKGFHVFEPNNRSRSLILRYPTLLPPVQKNRDTLRGGLSMSLDNRLSTLHASQCHHQKSGKGGIIGRQGIIHH